jgi:small subunit ribosomal protein S18
MAVHSGRLSIHVIPAAAGPLSKESTTMAQQRKPLKSKKIAPAKSIRIGHIDYKDTATLRKFISERGKIRARRVTGLSVQEQRKVAIAVKNARELALLPYASTAR